MPTFDQYVADINKAKNSAPTHDAFRDLIRWYGDALREFIERNASLTPKGGKVPKADGKKAEATIKKLFDAGKQIGIPAASKTDYIDRLADKEERIAGREKSGGDSSKAAGDGDEASEDYVDAAVSYYRSALCYAASGGLGAAPDYGKVSVQGAAQSYASELISAGQALKDAYDNEAAGDVSEIVAECVAAILLFDEAKRALVELSDATAKKGSKVDTQKDQDTADAGKTAADTKLGAFVK